jgi:hypothetical protein
MRRSSRGPQYSLAALMNNHKPAQVGKSDKPILCDILEQGSIAPFALEKAMNVTAE